MGWSMGAAVAWRYAQRHGTGLIAGLMTVDMSPKLVNGDGWQHGLLGQSAVDVASTTERMKHDWPNMAEAIATTMFGSRAGAPEFNRDAALHQILSNDPARMIPLWEDMVAMDHRDVIPQLSCPVLASCGAKSRVYPMSAAKWLQQTAPSGALHIFEQSGHSPHLEEPDAFVARLMEFRSGL